MALKKLFVKEGITVYDVPFKVLAKGMDNLSIKSCRLATEGKYIYLLKIAMKQKRVQVSQEYSFFLLLNHDIQPERRMALQKKYEGRLVLALAPQCEEAGKDEDDYLFQENRAMIIAFPDLPGRHVNVASRKYSINVHLLNIENAAAFLTEYY